jgi:hypothetical protein
MTCRTVTRMVHRAPNRFILFNKVVLYYLWAVKKSFFKNWKYHNTRFQSLRTQRSLRSPSVSLLARSAKYFQFLKTFFYSPQIKRLGALYDGPSEGRDTFVLRNGQKESRTGLPTSIIHSDKSFKRHVWLF